MAQDTKTTLDSIDWDAMATDLLSIFNYNKSRINSSYAGTEEKVLSGHAAATAALALTHMAAQARAQREAADKDNFKISKPCESTP